MHSKREHAMQAAIDRVMQAYTMMVNITPEEEQAAREKVVKHLAGLEADESALAVEALRYLRDPDGRRSVGS
jgi:hypothetical protein